MLLRNMQENGLFPERWHMPNSAPSPPLTFENLSRQCTKATRGDVGSHLPALLERLVDVGSAIRPSQYDTTRTLLGTGSHALITQTQTLPRRERDFRGVPDSILAWQICGGRRGRGARSPLERGGASGPLHLPASLARSQYTKL